VRGGTAAPVAVDAAQVQQIFGTAIAARPILPKHFTLYFISDSDTLTPTSQAQYQGVFEDIKRRAVYQVEVIGHTDTLGDKTYNQELSLRRAKAIRDRLAKDGLAAASISVAGRGDLDLAVKTADQVSEPRNRRVEITVR
jgi:outer membrane protein OmpA-like peptidoglycan-associated protein